MKKNALIHIPRPEEEDSIPNHLPVVLVQAPLFPGMGFSLTTTPQDTKTIRLATKQYNNKVLLVLQVKEQDSKKTSQRKLYKMGTVADISNVEFINPKSIRCNLNVLTRGFCTNLVNKASILIADIVFPNEIFPTTDYEQQELVQLTKAVLEDLHYLMEISDIPEMQFNSLSDVPPERLAEFASNFVHPAPEELQAILETLRVRERMEKALFLLRKEIKGRLWRDEIRDKVDARLQKNNKTFVLQEQLREIKQALGENLDPKDEDVERFRKRLEEIRPALSKEANDKITEEIDKLRTTNSQSPDYAISRNYLDWLTSLPWNDKTEDILDVKRAREVLERDHYGIEDVKKRILEFVSVAKLKGAVQGSILCFIGPPGVGKTSLGHSIAEALGRKFFRFSLGGMRDEAEIKGHRRTYIGAQPGKIVSALKTCGSKNPVIMLDEIDKLNSSYHGDPASALLEVLDPEQNNSFRDHFLDIPFDLSEVLFIATANVRDTIPSPLLDRMEVITLSGYIMEEKLNIAKQHLIPKQLVKNGLTKEQIAFPTRTLRSIILGYSRDSGVRALEKAIGSCMRKVAVQIAEGSQPADTLKTVTSAEAEEFLGKKLYFDDPLVKNPQPGVAMGLAWTAVGGTTLYIETLAIPGEPGVKITGQLGDVMKESSQIACSLVEANQKQYGIKKDFFKKHKLHIHVPAGAVPKDGPSAGITLASSLISAATGKTLPAGWAMTGELTITSRVLPVGGIKEKMIAAQRAGVSHVILPKDNKKDFLDISERARKGLTAHFVTDYSQVYSLLFQKN